MMLTSGAGGPTCASDEIKTEDENRRILGREKEEAREAASAHRFGSFWLRGRRRHLGSIGSVGRLHRLLLHEDGRQDLARRLDLARRELRARAQLVGRRRHEGESEDEGDDQRASHCDSEPNWRLEMMTPPLQHLVRSRCRQATGV